MLSGGYQTDVMMNQTMRSLMALLMRYVSTSKKGRYAVRKGFTL